MVENYIELANLFHKTNQSDSAIYYAKLALVGSQKLTNSTVTAEAAKLLGEEFESINPTIALGYFKTMMSANEKQYNIEKLRQTQNVIDLEQQRTIDLKAAKIEYEHTIRQNTLFGLLGTFIVLSLVLIRNNRNKQKANTLLYEQKGRVEHTLMQLETTQTQLIQAEKMASLGELTAGIAHEIQNPLNFVNNFSDVSAELIGELEDEQQRPNRDALLEAELLGDLKENLKKISLHGGRASNIVKGMLEHARTSTGQRQPTDLNALADEYLRLAYQGQRAKDKSFTCELITDFATDLGLADVVPQEIGRVLLNLFNNAFYAVSARAKQNDQPAYQPTVQVSTQRIGDPSDGQTVAIRVCDNGTGMPDAVKAKIFQPFFTTKPTGEGTGLGLSLSYDIVTKGHGGTLAVTSKEGEGTEFIVTI